MAQRRNPTPSHSRRRVCVCDDSPSNQGFLALAELLQAPSQLATSLSAMRQQVERGTGGGDRPFHKSGPAKREAQQRPRPAVRRNVSCCSDCDFESFSLAALPQKLVHPVFRVPCRRVPWIRPPRHSRDPQASFLDRQLLQSFLQPAATRPDARGIGSVSSLGTGRRATVGMTAPDHEKGTDDHDPLDGSACPRSMHHPELPGPCFGKSASDQIMSL